MRAFLRDLVAVVSSVALAAAPTAALAQKAAASATPPPPPPPSAEAPPKTPAPKAEAKPPAKATTPAPKAVATPAPKAAPAPRNTALWNRLHQAVKLMLDSRWTDAVPILTKVAATAQDPELRGRALALLEFAQAREKHHAPAPPAGPNAGRFPFVFTSTVGGIVVGIEADLLVQVKSVAAAVTLVLATTGAAFVASLLGTRHSDITEGEAVLYSDGMIVGTYDGALIASLASTNTTPNETTISLIALLGTVAGSALGYFGGRALHISPGAASLAGSGALWGTATGGLLLLAANPQSTQGVLGTLLLATNLGAGIGLGVGAATHISRSRVLLMDLGALLGGLALGGIGLIIETSKTPNSSTGKLTAGMALLGIYAGGALSLYLTRNLDRGSSGGGDGIGGSLISYRHGHLGVGLPLPEAMPVPGEPGHLAAGLSLASGTLP